MDPLELLKKYLGIDELINTTRKLKGKFN